MRQRRDGLHLDCVALVKWMVKDAWRIDHLPASILIVCVTDEEVLSGERIGLDIDICICNIIDEARLADIGEACDDKRACISVN